MIVRECLPDIVKLAHDESTLGPAQYIIAAKNGAQA
jgi:hypothetical protein